MYFKELDFLFSSQHSVLRNNKERLDTGFTFLTLYPLRPYKGTKKSTLILLTTQRCYRRLTVLDFPKRKGVNTWTFYGDVTIFHCSIPVNGINVVYVSEDHTLGMLMLLTLQSSVASYSIYMFH